MASQLTIAEHILISLAQRLNMDVLERREESPYFDHFDIDWHHSSPILTGKLMIPILGKAFEEHDTFID